MTLTQMKTKNEILPVHVKLYIYTFGKVWYFLLAIPLYLPVPSPPPLLVGTT